MGNFIINLGKMYNENPDIRGCDDINNNWRYNESRKRIYAATNHLNVDPGRGLLRCASQARGFAVILLGTDPPIASEKEINCTQLRQFEMQNRVTRK